MTRPLITPRTIAVIRNIADGIPRHQTATQLDVSESVVWRETLRARRHLHARNEAALIDRAIRHQLITVQYGQPAALERYLITTLELVAAGCSNADLAARLWLSVDGVKSRIAVICRRLDARDRAHAVAIGWQRGLLPPAATRPANTPARSQP